MNLEQTGYLWLLLCIPLLLIWSFVSHRGASRLLYRFSHRKRPCIPHLLAATCQALALVALIFSLASPRLRYNKVVFNRSGIDVAIGIDVSKSMLAEDEQLPAEGKRLFSVPNRLNRARYCALAILDSLKGERVGIFMFASKGVAIVPLTTDYGYCQYILKHVSDTAISIPGSDLGQAITTGASLFEESSRRSAKTMILISDGEDIAEDRNAIYEAAQKAASKGICIHTVGIGSGQDVMIPIRDAIGNVIEGYYQDEDGSYLKTRLEQETLKSVAGISGGSYFRAHDERSEERIVDAMLKSARNVEYTKATEPAWFSLSPLLLAVALLLFILGLLVVR